MYGLVNRAVEQLVVSHKGEAGWLRVCERAKISSDGFVAMCPYHDDVTFSLVGAASEELGLTMAQVLEAFGEYWILYTAEEGYGELLNAGGDNLRDFLLSLNDMHGRVETIFPQMRLPVFRVVDIAPGDYWLHYESERVGLAPMVTGLVKGLAKRFGQAVEVQHIAGRPAGGEAEVFRVRHLNEVAVPA